MDKLAVILLIAVAFGYVHARDKTTEIDVPRDWQCGYTDEQRAMGFDFVFHQCPEGMFDVNYCCEVHDICYNEQFGKQNCDDSFCDCLSAKAKEFCPPGGVTFDKLFCSLVRNAGKIPYQESKNRTNSYAMTLSKH